VTKWIRPSGYFGPYFGSGEAAVPGRVSATLRGTCSITAALTSGSTPEFGDIAAHLVGSGALSAALVTSQEATSGAGANTYTLTPRSREDWEAERRAKAEAAAEQLASDLDQAEPKPLKPIRDPFAAVLPQLTQLEVGAAPIQVPQLVVPADLAVSDEELAAVAVLLTARVNAYRWACTGTNQPSKAA